MTHQSSIVKDRLTDLERTVDALNGQVRDVQFKLRQATIASLTERIWQNLRSPRQENKFMSAVCSRHARPNTKLVHHGDFV